MRLLYRPLVEAEVTEVFDYLENIRDGLGDRFLADLEKLYGRLTALPESCREVLPRVRQATLLTFPYAVYYTIVGDTIEVIAVVHFARHPNVWRTRV